MRNIDDFMFRHPFVFVLGAGWVGGWILAGVILGILALMGRL